MVGESHTEAFGLVINFDCMDTVSTRDNLLFCLSSRPLEEKRQRAKTFDLQTWANLASEANRFDLMPLLYFRLGQQGTGMPETLCREFEKKWFVSASANLLVYHQLQRILKMLAGAGLPVVVLKGAYLAHGIYPDPALRPMGDVDLFVRREELAKTVEILEALGYHTSRPFWIEDECAVRHHLPAFSQPGQPIIEVHWSLVAPAQALTRSIKMDLEGVWERIRPLTLAGVPAYGLAPVDLVAHLCLHTCRDRFVFGLRALCDLQESLAVFGETFDWEALGQQARQWGIERCIYLTLYLVARYLQGPVPEAFLAALRPHDFSPEVAEWAMGQIFEGRLIGTPTALTQVQGQKPVWAKTSAILRGFFPAPAIIRKKYALSPDSTIVYPYYLFHAMDLFRLYGWNAVQLMRARPGVLHPVQRMTALGEWLFP